MSKNRIVAEHIISWTELRVVTDLFKIEKIAETQQKTILMINR